MLKTIFGFIVIQLGATSIVNIGEDRLSGEKNSKKCALLLRYEIPAFRFQWYGPFSKRGEAV